MSDQIENYMGRINKSVASLTEHLASWHAFALEGRQLPTVSYCVTADDQPGVKLTSDLSKLSAGDAETVKAILAQHHGAQVLQALTLVERTAEQFKSHLTSSPSKEADASVLGEDIPESEYPEGDHGNEDFE